MSSLSDSTNMINVILMTDPGNEIDDEVLLEAMKRNLANATVYVLCVPGGHTTEELDAMGGEEVAAEKRVERLMKLFPEF